MVRLFLPMVKSDSTIVIFTHFNNAYIVLCMMIAFVERLMSFTLTIYPDNDGKDTDDADPLQERYIFGKDGVRHHHGDR